MASISRRAYADMFGPTVGDRVRLADTELVIEVERDYTLAAGGGVLMITLVPDFVSPAAAAWRARAQEAATAAGLKATNLRVFNAFATSYAETDPRPAATIWTRPGSPPRSAPRACSIPMRVPRPTHAA